MLRNTVVGLAAIAGVATAVECPVGFSQVGEYGGFVGAVCEEGTTAVANEESGNIGICCEDCRVVRCAAPPTDDEFIYGALDNSAAQGCCYNPIIGCKDTTKVFVPANGCPRPTELTCDAPFGIAVCGTPTPDRCVDPADAPCASDEVRDTRYGNCVSPDLCDSIPEQPSDECATKDDANEGQTYFPLSDECQDCRLVKCAQPLLGPQEDGQIYERTGCCSSEPVACVDSEITLFPVSGCQDCRLVRCAAPLVGEHDGFIYEQTGCCSSEIVGCVQGEYLPAFDPNEPSTCNSPVVYATCEDPFPFTIQVCSPTPQCRLPSPCPKDQLLDASGFCRDASACIDCKNQQGFEWGEYSSCGPVTCDSINGELCPGQPIVGCHQEDCPLGQVRDANNRCILVDECPPAPFTCPKQTILTVSSTECDTTDGAARCGDAEECVEGFCCPLCRAKREMCTKNSDCCSNRCNKRRGRCRKARKPRV